MAFSRNNLFDKLYYNKTYRNEIFLYLCPNDRKLSKLNLSYCTKVIKYDFAGRLFFTGTESEL